MTVRNLLTTAQLCANKLQISVDRFYRIRADLERKGFPKPMTGFGTHRYDPLAVDLWFTAQLSPTLRAQLDHVDKTAIAAELAQRAASSVSVAAE